ncbi:MAG: hypothetical protein C4B58_16190 [Deltaproteobacteria bacterium]|nr:MAG: hypothetical protein C4B58_16190 [Deltaproteobacteria bacterium]
MQHTWIDGFLRSSLHNAAIVELGLMYNPDAVSRMLEFVLQRPNQPNQSVPTGKSIFKVFEENGRSLLILGKPGSGKTITLLQLAETLIHKAQQDEAQPVPIILNLSSWQHQELADWLIEEMFCQYQVAKSLTHSWIECNQLLLLLDGLDEVAEAYRDDCIKAINKFKASYPAELVVCSRIDDYECLGARLNLPNAVLIQPLTPLQIETHLKSFGGGLYERIREALAHDKDLQALAKSPLMLNIMIISYRDPEPKELSVSASPDDKRRYLLSTYVERMFERRPLHTDAGYDRSQALHWLMNLAGGMSRHQLSIFHIERLQPSSSPLTGIDPHLLMRIDPPELCSGFDPSLIF